MSEQLQQLNISSKKEKGCIKICDFETSEFLDVDNVMEDYKLNAKFMCSYDYFSHEVEVIDVSELESFFNRFLEKDSKNVIYFHNLKFDAHFFIDFLKKDFSLDIIQSGGLLMQIAVFRKDSNNVRHTYLKIKDSCALLRSSVKQLGNSVGLPKMETDYSEMSIENKKSVEYCARDCEIIAKSLSKMLEFIKKNFEIEIPINKLPLSVASLTKKVYLNYFANLLGISVKELKYMLYDDTYSKYFRNEYFGGRVEVFDLNVRRNVKYYDYNSAYPYVMCMDFPLPPYKKVSFIEATENADCYDFFIKNEENPWLNKKLFGMECQIDERNQNIPVFPERIEKSVYYRAVVKTRFLFLEEYKYAKELGLPIRVINVWFCSDKKPIFKDYITKCYNERKKETDEAFRLFYKYFMNSLYGKFAESEIKDDVKIIDGYQVAIERDENRKKRIQMPDYIPLDFGKNYMRCKKKTVQVESNVVIAAFVTAMQRLRLHKLLVKSNAIYTDTDSIVTENECETSNELGALKLESNCETFMALGQKEYHIEHKELEVKQQNRMKGVTLKLNESTLENYLNLYLKRKKQTRMVGVKECIRRNIGFGTILMLYKEKRNPYNKRWILEDFTTRPLQNDIEVKSVIEHNASMIARLICNTLTQLENET